MEKEQLPFGHFKQWSEHLNQPKLPLQTVLRRRPKEYTNLPGKWSINRASRKANP